MPLGRAWCVALTGLDGHLVAVEADVAQGLPAFTLTGLPDASLHEARDRVRAERPRFRARPETHQQLMTEFLAAVAANDTSRLVAMMKSDVKFVSDGGGKAPAALRVVNTPAEVAQLIMHLAGAKGGPSAMKFVTLNGVPSIWFLDGQGFASVAQFDIEDNLVRAIFIVRNPDKLAHLQMN